MDSDLSGGQRYPLFEQLGPDDNGMEHGNCSLSEIYSNTVFSIGFEVAFGS